MKTATLNLRVGEKLRRDLDRLATERDMALGEYVRFILLEHTAQATKNTDPTRSHA